MLADSIDIGRPFSHDDYAKAVLNVLEDAADDKARLMDMQRAVLNILEDAAAERALLKATQSAVINILDDTNTEKLRFAEAQKAVLNILEDLAVEVNERTHLEQRFRALLETAPDAIVIVDEAGKIALVNAQTETLFGYERKNLIGRQIAMLLPEWGKAGHLQIGTRLTAEPVKSSLRAELELMGLRRDGTEFPTVTLLSPLETNEGLLVSVAIRDVTRTKDIEHQIRSSLAEKETLLQEIHHRVKNNLQIVASLLSLQSGYIRDPQTLMQFQESQGRIRSMALIHEKLYQSASLAKVDLADYVQTLAQTIMRTYSENSNLQLECRLVPVSVSIDTALPVGLMLNELITNALKYAFPNGRIGRVLVSLDVTQDEQLVLCVDDNGVGLRPEFELSQADTLGLRLVRMFVKQLHAEITVNSEPGQTRFTICFEEAAVKMPME